MFNLLTILAKRWKIASLKNTEEEAQAEITRITTEIDMLHRARIVAADRRDTARWALHKLEKELARLKPPR